MLSGNPFTSSALLNPRNQILSILLCAVVFVASALAGNIPLWTGAPLPSEDNVSDLPWVGGAEVSPEYIHEGTEDLGWLHGVAIIEHEGAFHTSWANSPSGENSSAERVRGKSLPVGQSNWLDQPVVTIADDPDGTENPDRRSHGAFWSVNGDLYAFPARWDEEGAGTHFPGLTFEAYKLNETTGGWESQGQAGDDSWTLDTPAQVANGNWIMGGVDANYRSAVLISDGDSPTQWTTVKPPQGGGNFSETTVIVNGSEVLAIARNQNDNVAGVSISHDNGQTWSEFQTTNFLMSDSKPAAGVLSTGQRYLISNQGPESDRDTLTIAVSRPGEKTLSKVWKIRDSASPDPDYPGDATKRSQWSYPYAHEHDGNLYVVYSATKEDAVLSVIPISDLTLDARADGQRLAADQFDYADGDLAGQPRGDDPAQGFTGAWSNPKTGGATRFVSTEAAPLALPDGTDLPSSPRYVQHEAGTGEAAWARRRLETASVDFGAEDTVFYVSAQMRKSDGGGTSGEWLQVQLADSGANGTPFFMGFSSREQVHLGAEPGTENSDIAVGGDLVAGQDYFFVAKIITHATGEDQLFLGVYGGTAEDGFADALPSEEPMEWHLTNAVDHSGVADALQITCGPNATGAVDGVRFGTSWESVTAIPEPEAMFLFVMATAIGIFKRR